MKPASEVNVLAAGAAELGVFLSPAQLASFEQYQSLLLAWNEKHNLTAITDPTSIQIRHFLDALSCSLATGDLNGQRLIDVGSGAGFPGLPLKILYPELELTLVDSVAKKCVFLTEAVAELGLRGVTIIAERAEVLGRHPDHRDSYTWAVARSVAHLSVLAEYLLPLCIVGGHVLAQKGENVAQEVEAAAKAIERLGGSAAKLRPIDLPGHDRTHFLVVISKTAPTSSTYPRRPGIPSKRPLS